MDYYDLNINQRINLKGYVEQKAKYFGTKPARYCMLAWMHLNNVETDANGKIIDKTVNELLFFRSTPRGYTDY